MSSERIGDLEPLPQRSTPAPEPYDPWGPLGPGCEEPEEKPGPDDDEIPPLKREETGRSRGV